MGERFIDYFTYRAFDFTGVVNNIVFTISLLVVFYSVEGKDLKKNAIFVAVYAVAVYAALLMTSAVTFMINSDTIYTIIVPKLIVMLVYVIAFAKYKVQTRIMLAAMLYIINICLIEAGSSLTGALNVQGTISADQYIRAMFTTITVIVAVFLRVYNIDRFERIPNGYVVVVCCFCVIGFLGAIFRISYASYFNQFDLTDYYTYSYYSQIFATITLLIIIFYELICYFFVYYALLLNSRNMVLNRNVAQRESDEMLVKLSDENLKQIRSIKHEIKNRYSVMQVMLQNKQYDELENYFKQINEEAVGPLSYVNTGNQSFDVVLNLEISKAMAHSIPVETKLIIPPELPFTDADLSGIMTNLIDNAIEACLKIDGERKIEIYAQMVHSYLVIKVCNTVSSERAQSALLLETDKTNKESHGFGSKIIDSIVDKYSGQVNRSVKDNIFIVDIMLDTQAAVPLGN